MVRLCITCLFIQVVYVIIFKIPPALWATGGFGLACQHTSLQLLHPILRSVLEEGFSPPPTSSPGLWTAVSRGAVTTYIRFFRHPDHYHFFVIFPIPFVSILASILGSKTLPKSTQHRKKSKKIVFKKKLKKRGYGTQGNHRTSSLLGPRRTIQPPFQ